MASGGAPMDAPTLISFDIDGTLALGDPPGPIPAAFVHFARAAGCVIGSASDRTRREQALIWSELGLEPDFTGGKHHLHEVKATFPCVRFVHVGDTLIDAAFAAEAAFEFVSAPEVARHLADPPATAEALRILAELFGL